MPNGRIRLVRNHEDRGAPGSGSVGGDLSKKYDARGGGGTTTLEINPFTRRIESDWVSLNGTIVNCAGGKTPWGSWITCEETTAGVPDGWDKQHGYCFEVPAAADSTVQAVAIPDMGRFAHEAVAVDPNTGIVYETEDSGPTSGFYRFLPKTPGRLVDGGKLQMLAIEGTPNYNAATGQIVGKKLPVAWVDIAIPNPPGQGSEDVYNQGSSAGAARFARLEGCWYGESSIFFASTSGGDAGEGQIWQYRPDAVGNGWLSLVFESPDASVLNAPDNITVTPQGALLLCEDGSGQEFLHGLTLDGKIFPFAVNLDNGFEWAGACFAVADPAWNNRKVRGDNPPLGSWWERVTLFVNRQGNTSGANPPSAGNEGYTFAIWGPWKDGAI